MFVKVDDKNNVLQYPYSFGNLRMDFANISFPADASDESINYLNVYKVQQTERPSYDTYDDGIKILVDSVELVNEKWVQKWIIENVNEELAIINVRRKRDKLLSETDWMALSDNILTEEWAAYRQALREIPQQTGFPFDVDFPVKPS